MKRAGGAKAWVRLFRVLLLLLLAASACSRLLGSRLSAFADACRCIRLPAGTVLSGGGGGFFFPSRLGAAGIVRASARNQQMSAAPRPCAASLGFILRYVLTEGGVGVRYEFWGAVKGGDEEVIWRWQG